MFATDSSKSCRFFSDVAKISHPTKKPTAPVLHWTTNNFIPTMIRELWWLSTGHQQQKKCSKYLHLFTFFGQNITIIKHEIGFVTPFSGGRPYSSIRIMIIITFPTSPKIVRYWFRFCPSRLLYITFRPLLKIVSSQSGDQLNRIDKIGLHKVDRSSILSPFQHR